MLRVFDPVNLRAFCFLFMTEIALCVVLCSVCFAGHRGGAALPLRPYVCGVCEVVRALGVE